MFLQADSSFIIRARHLCQTQEKIYNLYYITFLLKIKNRNAFFHIFFSGFKIFDAFSVPNLGNKIN